MDVKELLRQMETGELKDISCPPSVFVDLQETVGWQAVERVLGSWILLRREKLEQIDLTDEKERISAVKMQADIELLRSLIRLPSALAEDATLDQEGEEEDESK